MGASLQLPGGIITLNPQPEITRYYNVAGTAYTNPAQVLAQIVLAARYIGQTFLVGNTEYWFSSGTADANLIQKVTDVTTVLTQVITNGDTTHAPSADAVYDYFQGYQPVMVNPITGLITLNKLPKQGPTPGLMVDSTITDTGVLVTINNSVSVTGGVSAASHSIPGGLITQYLMANGSTSTVADIIAGLVTQTITNGDTTHAPSGDAVFDALALKADVSQLHNPVTLGTANGLSLVTQVLSLALASTSITGALSFVDWNTFNNKQPQLNGIGFVKANGTVISYDNTIYQPLLTNPITGTGTTNRLSKFITPSSLGNSSISDTGSLVTISNPLDIQGTTNLSSTVTLGTLPTSSAGTYDILTRNTGTGVIEKVLSTTFQLALGFTPENIANKQNSMVVDGTGIKYPTVDAVNFQTNYIARAVVATGFLDTTDPFTISRFDDFTLHISASSYGVAFSQRFKTLPYAPSDGIINIPAQNIPLSAIGLAVDGTYIRFVGIQQNGTIVWSPTQFIQSPTICQLGLVLVKRVAGVTSFIDINRTAITIPDVSAYSNLDTTATGVKATTSIAAIPGTLSHSNTLGKFVGISVAWGTSNNDSKIIPLLNPTSFTRLHPGNALTVIPPPTFTVMDPTQYWNGAALIAIPGGAGVSSVQRLLFTVNGNFVWQYGEATYANLIAAQNNILQAVFTNILPEGTFAEVGRMAITRGCTDLASSNAQYYPTGSSGGGGGTSPIAPTAWGFITGNIGDQLDLAAALNLKANAAITITPTAPLTGGGDLTVNRVLGITQAGTASNGYLSAADWNTFNNKQGAIVNPVTGTGTAGQVAFWDGTNTQTGSNDLFWNNTTKELRSSGNFLTGIGFTIDNADGNIRSYAGDQRIHIGGSDYTTFDTYNGSWIERMRIANNGNIGIGTTSPLAKVHVELASSDGGGGADGFRIASGLMGINLGTESTNNYSWIQSALGGSGVRNLAFNPHGGNVGIGTSTPGVKFVNSGGSNASTSVLGSGTTGSQALLAGNGLYGLYQGVSNDGTVWNQVQRNDGNTDTYNYVLQPNGGYVGIGIISPITPLHVIGKTNIASVGNTSPALGSLNGSFNISPGGAQNSYGIQTGSEGSGTFWMQNQTNTGSNSVYPISLNPLGGNVLIGKTDDNGYKLQVQGLGHFANGILSSAHSDFVGPTGNTYSTGALQVQGNGGANTIFPLIGFHQPGLYAGELTMIANNTFRFTVGDGATLSRVSGANAISSQEFVTLSQLNSVVGGGVNGTGTAGYLPRWFDSDTLQDSGVYDSGSQITIARSSSTFNTLIVQNNSYSSGNSSGTVAIGLGYADHSAAKIEAFKQSQNISGIKIYGELGFNNPTLLMTMLANSGSVGIGNDNPPYQLTVDSYRADIASFSSTDNANNQRLTISSGSSGIILDASAWNSLAASYIALNTNGGNVGIGLTGPQYQLHMSKGDIKAGRIILKSGTINVPIPAQWVRLFGSNSDNGSNYTIKGVLESNVSVESFEINISCSYHDMSVNNGLRPYVRILHHTYSARLQEIMILKDINNKHIVYALINSNDINVSFSWTLDANEASVTMYNDLVAPANNTGSFVLPIADYVVADNFGYVELTNGYIGIGTNNPQSHLTIAGNLGGIVGSGGDSLRLINTDTGNYASIGAGIVGVSNGGMEFSIDGQRSMVIFPGGNVGIGVVDPASKLSVNGAVLSHTGGFLVNRTNNGDSTTPYYENLVKYNEPNYPTGISIGNAFNATTGTYLKFTVNGTGAINNPKDAIIIVPSGNVLLGSATDVSGRLQVTGQLGSFGMVDNTNGNIIMLHSGVQAWKIGITSANSSTFHIGNDIGGSFANKILSITNAGNIGIGVTSPVYKLQVSGNSYFSDQIIMAGGANILIDQSLFFDGGDNSSFQIYSSSGSPYGGDTLIIAANGSPFISISEDSSATIFDSVAIFNQRVNAYASIYTPQDNTVISAGNNGDIGFFKKSGFTGRLAVNSVNPFTIARTTSAGLLDPSNTFNDIFSIDTNNTVIAQSLKYTQAIQIGGSDLNSITDAGFYAGSALVGAPDGGWFYVTIERHSTNDWVHQTATSFGSGNTGNRVYTRTKEAAVWKPWKELLASTGGLIIAGAPTPDSISTGGSVGGAPFTAGSNGGLTPNPDLFYPIVQGSSTTTDGYYNATQFGYVRDVGPSNGYGAIKLTGDGPLSTPKIWKFLNNGDFISGGSIQSIYPGTNTGSISMGNVSTLNTSYSGMGITTFNMHTGGGYADVMTVRGNGRVGIGTTSPAYKLDIFTAAGSEDVYSEMQLQASNYGYILGGGLKQFAGAHLVFSSNNGGAITERARFNDSGLFGIGTNNPLSMLTVVPNNDYSATGTPTMRIGESSDNGLYHMGLSFYLPSGGSYSGIIQSRDAGNPSNTLISPEGGNVGIGVLIPAARLHVNTQFTGTPALKVTGLQGGSGSTQSAFDSGAINLGAGYGNLSIYGDTSDGSFQMQTTNSSGSGAQLVRLNKLGGAVTIGPGGAVLALQVAGNLQYSGTISNASDARIKENIQPLENGVDTLLKLKPCTFDRIDSGTKDNIGFIAQEVEEVLPQLVNKGTHPDLDIEDFRSLDSVSIIPILVKAIQELKAEIDDLRNQLNSK